MNLKCPHCKGDVRLDVARLVPGRTTHAACPRCRQTFALPSDIVGTGEETTTVAPPWGPEGEAWLERRLQALRAEVKAELLEEVLARVLRGADTSSRGTATGAKTLGDAPSADSLVVADDMAMATAVGQSLVELGYVPEQTADLRGAVQVLAERQRRVVIVDQVLAGDEQGGMKVLTWINRLPGARRRRMFVGYIAPDMPSLDAGSAFTCGANVVINRQDTGRLTDILRHAFREREQLYGTFLELHEAVNG